MTNAALQNVTLIVPVQDIPLNVTSLVEGLMMIVERMNSVVGSRSSLEDRLFNDAVSNSYDSVNGFKIMNKKVKVVGMWKKLVTS